MGMHGRNNGKKLLAVRIIKHAFEIIHLLTGQNPLQGVTDAIINSGPREDSTRIGRAGTVRRQAVDVSPLRRVNQAIWLLVTGAREAAFRNIKTIAECLADELINAAKGSPTVTPSRRRTSWSVSPSPTVNEMGHLVAGILARILVVEVIREINPSCRPLVNGAIDSCQRQGSFFFFRRFWILHYEYLVSLKFNKRIFFCSFQAKNANYFHLQ